MISPHPVLDVHCYFDILGGHRLLDETSEDNRSRLDPDVLHEFQHLHGFVHFPVLALEFDQDREGDVARFDAGSLHLLEEAQR